MCNNGTNAAYAFQLQIHSQLNVSATRPADPDMEQTFERELQKSPAALKQFPLRATHFFSRVTASNPSPANRIDPE